MRGAAAGIIAAVTRDPRTDHDPFEQTRMTLGDHLDELRGCILRSLLALTVVGLILIWPSRYLFSVLVRPAMLALRHHGQPETLLQTGPTEVIAIYIKVILIAAVVIASPYVLYELWRFVAAGLYPKEKRFVLRLLPASVGLFLTGVVFMYLFVLLLSLNWLVGFSAWLPLPEVHANPLERVLLQEAPETATTTAPALEGVPPVPLLAEDPKDVPPGRVWFNTSEMRLKVSGEGREFSVALVADEKRSVVTTHFKVGDYLSFLLKMTIAFGLAFQVPLVVYALARLGIVTLTQFRYFRRYVWFGIICIAAVLAPPDLLSHLLLSLPMIVLFEIGLWFAARAGAGQPLEWQEP